MKRIDNRTFRLKYRLKAFVDGKWVQYTTCLKKSSVTRQLIGSSAKQWHIYIGYGKDENGEEMHNEGIYKTKKEVLEFLTIMTEKQLLDYLEVK